MSVGVLGLCGWSRSLACASGNQLDTCCCCHGPTPGDVSFGVRLQKSVLRGRAVSAGQPACSSALLCSAVRTTPLLRSSGALVWCGACSALPADSRGHGGQHGPHTGALPTAAEEEQAQQGGLSGWLFPPRQQQQQKSTARRHQPPITPAPAAAAAAEEHSKAA